MKVLELTPRLPYPLTDGGAVGIFKAAEAVASTGVDLTIFTYPERDPTITAEGVAALKRFARVIVADRPLPTRTHVLLRTILKGAYPVERRMMESVFDLLEQTVRNDNYDLVHVDHSHMGKYGAWIKQRFGLPFVLREHNVEAQIYQRFAATERNPLIRAVATLHGKRLREEERSFFRLADHVVAITNEDRGLILTEVPEAHVSVIPAGVDTTYYQPSTGAEEDLVMWIGGMGWEPNQDAINHFLSDVYPQILAKRPGTRLELVGQGTDRISIPPALATSVAAFGRVPDIRPFLARAGVMVVPLRVGGGMRLKILDFLAAGKAVVSTRIGAEGNIARDGHELMLRDDSSSFADTVVQLLSDPNARHQLGANGRKMVETSYSWAKIGEAFHGLYEQVKYSSRAPI